MAVLGAAQLGAILTILQVIKIRIFSEHSLGWHLTRCGVGDTVLVIWSRRQGRDGGWVRNPTVRTHSPAEDKSRRVFYWQIFCSSIQDTMKSSMLTLSPRLAPDTLLTRTPAPRPGCLENGRNVIFHRSRGRSNFYTSGKCGVNIMCAGPGWRLAVAGR